VEHIERKLTDAVPDLDTPMPAASAPRTQ